VWEIAPQRLAGVVRPLPGRAGGGGALASREAKKAGPVEAGRLPRL